MEFFELIEDRDLWRFKHGERTRQFIAALDQHPHTIVAWEKIVWSANELVQQGELILRAYRASLERIVKESYWLHVGNHYIPVCNAPYQFASDAANQLLAKYPQAAFAACWFVRGDGKVQFSLRSDDSRADVSEVAKRFGGGGHRNAAGFEVARAMMLQPPQGEEE